MYENEINKYLKEHDFETFHPKAVLFDMDGVLYNSMPNHAYSWHKSMESFNIPMTEAEAYKYEGMRGVETIKLKVRETRHEEISDAEAQRMYDEKSRMFSTCPPAQIMEGVKELQEKIKADGLQIVVVTGSGQHSLLNKLAHDFEGLIKPELIVSAFDVKHGKPNPEPYLKGLEKAQVNPWEAIVVENAPLGVRSAVAARIFTIAVNTGPLPNKMLLDEGANLIFSKMTDLCQQWENIRNATSIR